MLYFLVPMTENEAQSFVGGNLLSQPYEVNAEGINITREHATLIHLLDFEWRPWRAWLCSRLRLQLQGKRLHHLGIPTQQVQYYLLLGSGRD